MRLMRGSPDFFFGLERYETIMRENGREGREGSMVRTGLMRLNKRMFRKPEVYPSSNILVYLNNRLLQLKVRQ